jgi:hypothetical protein
VIYGEDLMPGAWLAVGATGWALCNAIENVTLSSAGVGVIAHGTLSAAVVGADGTYATEGTHSAILARGHSRAPRPGEWHALRLAVKNDTARAWLDGVPLFDGVGVAGRVPAQGFTGFGTGDWGQFVLFDDFKASTI